MGKLQIAVSAAIALSAAALIPATAHAESTSTATPTTYYVNNAATPSCADSGPGTKAAPFCTIQHAASVATVPGDVVVIEGGQDYSGEVDITASGTAAAPITFEAAGVPGRYAGAGLYGAKANPVAYGISITGASYVKVEDLAVQVAATGNQILVQNSSHITVDNMRVTGTALDGKPQVEVDGNSSDVTLSRDQVMPNASSEPGIDVDTSGTGNVITSDSVSNSAGGNGISVQGSPGAVITGNSVVGYCGSGIYVGDDANGTASGATIEDNVVANAASTSDCSITAGYALDLQSAADAVGAIANYNTFYPGGAANAFAYSWAGTVYGTPAAFSSATGQGAADSAANPQVDSYGDILNGSSPLINAANSNAPDELATDIYDQKRVYDPNVAETGVGTTGYDRGAYQYAESVSLSDAVNPFYGTAGSQYALDAGTAASNWAGATFSYTYDFGDGTIDKNAGSSDVHRYMSQGSFIITVTAISSYGGTGTEQFDASVGQADFTLTPEATQNGPLGATVNASIALGDPSFQIQSETADFGDGSATASILDGPVLHTYPHPGTYTVTVTAFDNHDDEVVSTVKFSTAGSDFVPYGPTRLLDTRIGLGGTANQLADDGSIKLKIAGNGSIPAGVTAVDLNLTVVGATGNGYIQADTGSNSGTSNLNYRAGAIYSNSVVATVASDGTITLANFGVNTSVKPELIADVSGYFTPVSASGYVEVSNKRLLDTRAGVGGSKGKLAAGHHDVLQIAGADSQLPASGITAVELNLTETDTSGSGFLVAYPDGASVPNASDLDWQGGATKAAGAVVPVGADGSIDIYNGSSDGGGADVLADVTGYFTESSGAAQYVPVAPARVLDTRKQSALAANTADDVNLSGVGGLPAVNAAYTIVGYVLNATATQTQAPGWLLVAAGGQNPDTSSLNWTGANQTVENLVFAGEDDGTVMFYNGGGTVSRPTQVIADAMGYFATQ